MSGAAETLLIYLLATTFFQLVQLEKYKEFNPCPMQVLK